MSNYHLPQVWAEYLSQFEWDFYAHLTFRDYPHIESACKLFDLMVHEMNREIYGKTYWKDKNKGVIWARGTEDQKRGAIHFHALIGGVPDFVNPVKYRNLWYAKGGICQILLYRKENGAEYYMSKSTYAWKRGEIDLSDTLKKEVDGIRICGKVYHQEFIRRSIEDKLRVHLSFFSWD